MRSLNIQFFSTKETVNNETLLTVKVNNKLLHSLYYPLKEAEKYVDGLNIESNEKTLNVVFYGLGLGYHIKALADRFGDKINITVFDLSKELYEEPEIKNSKFIKQLFNMKNVDIHLRDFSKEFCEAFSEAVSKCDGFYIYRPSLELIPEAAKKFSEIILEYEAEKSTELKNKELLDFNSENNNKLKNVKTMHQFFNEHNFKNQNVIIVAGGPSLNMSIDKLKELAATGNFFIITMGTPLKMLLENDIKPGMFCSTDPLEHVFNQINGLDTEKFNIPMCFLYTSSYKAAESYKGSKYIFYNYDKINDIRIDCGNSVATAALSIAIAGKPKTVIFLGQDLAYINGKRHVDNTVYGKEHYHQVDSRDFLSEAVSGDKIYTNNFFYSVKRWIERTISTTEHIRFINCSKGLNIAGCENIDIEILEDVLNG
ncbi:motility associated factor glycosyltransferase family protein [Clostridium oryzae]|uniref:6-hydroxymethylpterin diphosphokinase MptE-like domain-containing protein n=1 Tax=Clostridium oryzae TaxID=1450648 RepID=A0A1V4IM17_9CLOT|nr:6-hydroxymethylpterin diphosphokinase MptE-like protein [Clostridium oryzae]OPJ60884.1 hypothetical protein CLORY_25910 [Clostridium oryzae]